MKSALSWLSLFFGTMSVVMLVKQVFKETFAASLQLLLDYYDTALTVTFGWLEALIASGLAACAAWLGVMLKLSPLWKHIFILLLVPVSAATRALSTSSKNLSVQVAAQGVLVALLVSVTWGITIHPEMHDEVRRLPRSLSLGLLFMPTIAVLYLDAHLFGSWSRPIQTGGRLVTILIASAITFFMVSVIVSIVSPEAEWGPHRTAVLSVAWTISPVLGYAIFLVVLGGSKALSNPNIPAGSPEIGRGILATFGGASVFLLSNAGLKLAGL